MTPPRYRHVAVPRSRDRAETFLSLAVEAALLGLGQQRIMPVGLYAQEKACKQEERLIAKLSEIEADGLLVAVSKGIWGIRGWLMCDAFQCCMTDWYFIFAMEICNRMAVHIRSLLIDFSTDKHRIGSVHILCARPVWIAQDASLFLVAESQAAEGSTVI